MKTKMTKKMQLKKNNEKNIDENKVDEKMLRKMLKINFFAVFLCKQYSFTTQFNKPVLQPSIENINEKIMIKKILTEKVLIIKINNCHGKFNFENKFSFQFYNLV